MIKNILFSIAFLFTINIAISQNKAINAEVLGKGKPILFLPGFTTPGSIWKETVKNLTVTKEAHLISYAGFNGMDPIEMPWYSSIKKELIIYIKKNNLQDVEIIGHSMGGTLAVDIAAALPNLVTKIILVDALPCMREVMMPNVPDTSVQFKGMATMMATNMTDNKEKVETVMNWILEADRKTYVYGYTDLLKLDLRNDLSKIKAKALILGAPTYGTIAKESMEKQYANLANTTVEMAPSGKHFIMFDESEWFYKKVNTFLTSE